MYKTIMLLSVTGIGLASYLLYQYLTPPHPTICYVNSSVNCEAATRGVLANTLGIPTALYGLAGYGLILVAAIRKHRRLLFGVSLFGLLFCLRITFIELFIIKTVCPVCIACQAVMAGVFILATVLLVNKKGSAAKKAGG